ncbi:MAG: DNA-formamidopyrimidine glycosylase family protein [Myxococcota bacterium]
MGDPSDPACITCAPGDPRYGAGHAGTARGRGLPPPARCLGAGQRLDAIRLVDRATVRGDLVSKPSMALPDGEAQLEALVGLTAAEPVRHGKRLGWAFGERGLLAHLGMTGHWVRRRTGDEPPPMNRLGLVFGDHVLWYLDTRRFGCVTPLAASEIAGRLRGDTGPDALNEPLDGPGLAERVRCRKAVKVALMEQQRLAGLGNIHASEACHRAKIAPGRRADALSDAEWDRLARAILDQLRFAIAAEDGVGDDGIAYVNLGGPNPFTVYRRTGEVCGTCHRGEILEEEMGGRATYWCPVCQPA